MKDKKEVDKRMTESFNNVLNEDKKWEIIQGDCLKVLEGFAPGTFDVKVPGKSIYNPNQVRKFLSKLWFEKRQLVWQGLYLNIDNFMLKRKIKNQKKI